MTPIPYTNRPTPAVMTPAEREVILLAKIAEYEADPQYWDCIRQTEAEIAAMKNMNPKGVCTR